MKNKRLRRLTINFQIKRIAFYALFIFIYPYFWNKKQLAYLKNKIDSLEKFKLRMKIIAKHNLRQLEILSSQHSKDLTSQLNIILNKILTTKLTERNISYVNVSIDQFITNLSHEKVVFSVQNKFRNAVLSGIQEFTILTQGYFSIVGMVYSNYKKFPKSIPFYKSKFAKCQNIDW